ncbi:ribonuclease H-like domain-containing protein [Tanacetum coccineum]
MGDEPLSTIPATESDEVIKSSVENLVPIPSEFEGMSEDTSDVPTCDNKRVNVESDFVESLINRDTSIVYSSKIDPILEEFVGELAHIAPISPGIVEADFDPNDDTSSDDDDFEDIEYVSLEEVNDVDQEKEFDLEDIFQIQDVILLTDSDSSDTFLSHSDNSLPKFESFSDDTEETRSGSTTTHANYSFPEYESFQFDNPSFPRPPPEPPDVEICLHFEPDAPVIDNFNELNDDQRAMRLIFLKMLKMMIPSHLSFGLFSRFSSTPRTRDDRVDISFDAKRGIASFDTSDTKNDTLAIPRPLIGYTDVENIVRLRSKHHKAVIDQGMTLDHGERAESLEASQNQPSQPIPKPKISITSPRFNSRTHHSAMTNLNTPPPPPALTLVEKLYAHFIVLNHIDGLTSQSDPPTDEWITADSIVKSWIFLTLSPTLRKGKSEANPASAKAAGTPSNIFKETKGHYNVMVPSHIKARLVANGSTQLAADYHFSSCRVLTILTDWAHLIISGHFVSRNASGMFLSQQKYATEVLDRAGMLNCKPCRTPVDTDSKLSADGALIFDSTLYRSLAGALQYLTFTRPDISYAVQQVCLFMHDPREPHLSALKRILRYVRGTLSYGLQLYSSTTSSLVAYSDADWAGCPTTRRSTSGYCVFLGNNLLSWSSKRQFTLSRSSAEAEYRGVANAVAETCWLRNLLRELHTPLATATLVYCDNVSAVYLSSNPVQHQRTKHIEIDIHFVRDLVATGAIRVLHVPSRYQYADIFTKGLPTSLFDEFRTSLSVRCPPAPTAGEAPKTSHLEAVKRIFRYIKGTTHLGLWYPKGTGIETVVYADSDHAGDYVDRKSTSGICTFVGCCLTSWFSKKQTALAISTTEAEYVSAGKACQQALWMKQALIDYDVRLDDVPIMCDNKGAIDLSKNPVQHSRTKHIEIRHHFLRDNVQKGHISIEKVSSADNIADILTKP